MITTMITFKMIMITTMLLIFLLLKMTRVEADLATSKELREKQAEEFHRQKEEDRRNYQQHVREQSVQLFQS